ncbi:protein tis11 [Anaeramoeba flamelloides]|uniref:Protein tis11 n=1 Tax=Anaeramoeba flamelloides TaxID=1746091 RepID=A0ABQ8YW22_9EUKA|nr:protein tis11 [Anaeramoeba flamelloides]
MTTFLQTHNEQEARKYLYNTTINIGAGSNLVLPKTSLKSHPNKDPRGGRVFEHEKNKKPIGFVTALDQIRKTKNKQTNKTTNKKLNYTNKKHPFNKVSSEKRNKPKSYKQSGKKSAKTNLYKTEVCRSWIENGYCKYGKKCQFAHDLKEKKKDPDTRISKETKKETKNAIEELCKFGKENGFDCETLEVISKIINSKCLKAMENRNMIRSMMPQTTVSEQTIRNLVSGFRSFSCSILSKIARSKNVTSFLLNRLQALLQLKPKCLPLMALIQVFISLQPHLSSSGIMPNINTTLQSTLRKKSSLSSCFPSPNPEMVKNFFKIKNLNSKFEKNKKKSEKETEEETEMEIEEKETETETEKETETEIETETETEIEISLQKKILELLFHFQQKDGRNNKNKKEIILNPKIKFSSHSILNLEFSKDLSKHLFSLDPQITDQLRIGNYVSHMLEENFLWTNPWRNAQNYQNASLLLRKINSISEFFNENLAEVNVFLPKFLRRLSPINKHFQSNNIDQNTNKNKNKNTNKNKNQNEMVSIETTLFNLLSKYKLIPYEQIYYQLLLPLVNSCNQSSPNGLFRLKIIRVLLDLIEYWCEFDLISFKNLNQSQIHFNPYKVIYEVLKFINLLFSIFLIDATPGGLIQNTILTFYEFTSTCLQRKKLSFFVIPTTDIAWRFLISTPNCCSRFCQILLNFSQEIKIFQKEKEKKKRKRKMIPIPILNISHLIFLILNKKNCNLIK